MRQAVDLWKRFLGCASRLRDVVSITFTEQIAPGHIAKPNAHVAILLQCTT
jgi:hypothetical protein